MADRSLTLMAVLAHPDDEATGTGGILARCAAEGIHTVLVTCTDGACGDGPGGVKPGEVGHDPAAVVTMRRRELEASCEVLNVTHLELLGYADSGMMVWPTNVYWTTAPRSKMQEFGQGMRELGADWDEPEPSTDGGELEIGLPDDEITTWVDTTEFGGQKYDALGAHASQSENIFFLRMGKERFAQMMGIETFIRVHDTTGAVLPEDDLFAGLR